MIYLDAATAEAYTFERNQIPICVVAVITTTVDGQIDPGFVNVSEDLHYRSEPCYNCR